MSSTAAHRAAPRRRTARNTVVAATAATAAAAAILGGGIYASWDSTSSVSSGLYSAATVGSAFSTSGDANFTTPVLNMVPGDYTTHYTDLQNLGSVDQAFTGTVTGTGGLIVAGGLQVAIDSCSVAWDQSDGTCSGDTTAVLANADVATAGAPAFGSIAAHSSMHLKVTVSLPTGADESLAGATGSVTIGETAGIAATGSDRSNG